MLRFILLAGALLWLGLTSITAQASSTLRCHTHLISVGDHQQTVLDKCGIPSEKIPVGYKEIVDIYRYTHEVRVDEWVYGPRNGMYHFLRFEGGTLVRISSSR